MFPYYCKRIFTSLIFWICVVVLGILMIACEARDIFCFAGDLSMLYCLTWMMENIVLMLIHTIAAVPFLYILSEELEMKSVYYQMVRSSKKSYYLGRAAAAFLSAAAVAFLALVLFTAVAIFCGVGDGVWKTTESLMSMFRGMYFEEQLQKSELPVYLVHGAAVVTYAAPWVLWGLLVSAFSKNRYIIFAAPYIAYMTMNYVTQVVDVMWLSPGTTILHRSGAAMAEFGGGIFYNLRFNLSLALVLTIVYCIVSERRFRHEGI